MAITSTDLSNWQSMIDSGNRAGFYYDYYLIIGVRVTFFSAAQLHPLTSNINLIFSASQYFYAQT